MSSQGIMCDSLFIVWNQHAMHAREITHRVDLDMLAGIMDALSIDSAHIVGHDWGSILVRLRRLARRVDINTCMCSDNMPCDSLTMLLLECCSFEQTA